MKYFEDIVEGNVSEPPNEYLVTADEIIEFCKVWDPLPFHTDEAAAAKSVMGKLFTSAIHSIAIMIRFGHEIREEQHDVVAGLGWDEVRFHEPVCAGDSVRLRGTLIEKRKSESRPGTGVIRTKLELINQHDRVALSFVAAALVRCRPQTG